MPIHTQEVPEEYIIPSWLFNNEAAIEARALAMTGIKAQRFVKRALRFIYITNAPLNSPMRPPSSITGDAYRAAIAERTAWLVSALSPAEWQVFKNLGKYAGSSRRTYGHAAVRAARAAHYRCRICKMPDVRTMEMDHINGRSDTDSFQLLCSNCHKIKTRNDDWITHEVIPTSLP